jgi:hypothetical protein
MGAVVVEIWHLRHAVPDREIVCRNRGRETLDQRCLNKFLASSSWGQVNVWSVKTRVASWNVWCEAESVFSVYFINYSGQVH